ncbi:MAG: hypothetical protein R3B72_21630 [Polyangiaceae bacterium]
MKWTQAALLLPLTLAACKKSLPLSPEPPTWLDSEVDALAHRSAPEAERDGELLRGSSPREGQGERFSVVLDEGRCYYLAGVGDDQIAALTLYLWDPDGSRAETVRGKSGKTVLSHCPEATGMHDIEVKPTRGNGHFALGIFSIAAPTPDPEPVAPPEPEGPDLRSLVEKEAGSSAPGAERVGDFFTDRSDKRDWFAALEVGYCYWWIGAGEPGAIDELTLYLWDPDGRRVTQSKSQSHMVTIGHCPQKGGMHKFQAAIGSGDGKYLVGLYKRRR